MDGVRAHRIAGGVVDRHEEKGFDRTKKDHLGSEGSEHEESAWSYRGEVEGPEEPIQKSPRHGSFNADRTPPSYGNASPSLIFGCVEQEDAMPDNLSKRGQPDRSKIAMNEAFEVRYWTKHLGVSKEELQRAVDKVGNSAAAVKKELEKEWRRHGQKCRHDSKIAY